MVLYHNDFTTGLQGLTLIKDFEGLELDAYLCPSNVPTIGYGHTKDVCMGDTIEYETAVELLKHDLCEFENIVKDCVTTQLNQNQFDALVSFTFNLGGHNLSRSTLLKRVNARLFSEVQKEFMKWVYSNGSVLVGLQRRRYAEAKLFHKPVGQLSDDMGRYR